ncbi:MAG TPA: glycosyltransferase family 4 protein [Candidatus Limnocylindria bacterium]|nr:glycosyltransferase family 4 protein [Candidatus Limnocylindria bacterium]
MTTSPLLDHVAPAADARAPAGRLRAVQVMASGAGGGAQVHVQDLAAGLLERGVDVEVISLSDGPAVRRLRSAGIAVQVVDTPDDTEALARVVELLRSRPPHIVHNHMYRAEVIGTRAALALAELTLPRPYVIGTVHSSRVRSGTDRELLRSLTPSMDRLIAVSKAIVAKLEAEGRSVVPIELIYNGVDLERYAYQEACCTLPEEYGFAEGTPLVGVVARLEPEKGHRTLLEAWPHVLAQVPKARLLIIGEGTVRATLEAQAESLGLLGEPCAEDRCVGTRRARPGARVVFTGLRDDVPAVTAALDVAVLPSYREAQGLAILEAMALRRPVVATAVGGVPEMVEHERTGLLVPPRDAPALAAAIGRLLTDHPLADTLARTGHDQALARFSLTAMVDAVARLYEDGAGLPAGRPGVSQAA